ncbi:hypothetical protein Pan3_63 [Pseudanabaena phage Pan3]|nr:hypothetical protein Pan3_63 [Pseudanabaena phage Pan3]
MKMVVANIYIGHVIETADDRFVVKGNMKMRGRYLYVCTNKAGRTVSLSRDDVLQAQRDGDAKVLAA